ncbi:MAG: hypothetical protein KJ566_00815 [Nanoarchaeota archaeon]|nr:hypothetical protein [Nanoarchaeota archaeon]
MEKEEIFSSKVKHDGIFLFKDFYKFCYDWLTDETGLLVAEGKYAEKLAGDAKEINIEWEGTKKITDYFKYSVKVKFRILNMKEVEIMQGNAKIKTNKGSVEIKTSGNLLRDYDGKFEKTGFQKFLRSIYEKWVIASRIEQMEDKLIGKCDEFLNQAKAWLDLEGRK